MKTLLSKIKGLDSANKRKKMTIDKTLVEVSLAWMKDEVSLTSIAKGLNVLPMAVYLILARALREAYRRGDIVENTKLF